MKNALSIMESMENLCTGGLRHEKEEQQWKIKSEVNYLYYSSII